MARTLPDAQRIKTKGFLAWAKTTQGVEALKDLKTIEDKLAAYDKLGNKNKLYAKPKGATGAGRFTGGFAFLMQSVDKQVAAYRKKLVKDLQEELKRNLKKLS